MVLVGPSARKSEFASMSDLGNELRFLFAEGRAVQASALLMRAADGRENYTKLLKLLYLADRRSLIETGRPITGASVVNMAHGPVLSEVYECIRDKPGGGLWDRHIRTDGYDVELIEDPGDDKLSDYDVAVLSELAEQYKAASYSYMIDIVHKLPEWRSPAPAKVASLPAADILRASGESDETICGQSKRVAYLESVDKLLGS